MAAASGSAGTARPPRLRWSAIGLVVAGGAVGAASREALVLVIPLVGPVPIAIALINVVGAFLLGYLYEAVTRIGPPEPGARNLKLLIGTGFCGGFTTYSSLALDATVLATSGHLGLSVLYALGTVVIGACATVAGIALANRVTTQRGAE